MDAYEYRPPPVKADARWGGRDDIMDRPLVDSYRSRRSPGKTALKALSFTSIVTCLLLSFINETDYFHLFQPLNAFPGALTHLLRDSPDRATSSWELPWPLKIPSRD